MYSIIGAHKDEIAFGHALIRLNGSYSRLRKLIELAAPQEVVSREIAIMKKRLAALPKQYQAYLQEAM